MNGSAHVTPSGLAYWGNDSNVPAWNRIASIPTTIAPAATRANHLHRGDGNPRLPGLEGTLDAIRDLVTGADGVRLEEKEPEAAAKLRQPQPLALLCHKDDSDGFAHVHFTFRPCDPTIAAHAWWETDASSEYLSDINHFFLALSPGTGKQIKK